MWELLNKKWQELLKDQKDMPYFNELSEFVDKEYRTKTVYPPKDMLFSAFNVVAPEDVKVVILGQDPYHNPGQANGMAFSVQEGVKCPPSLVNIYKSLNQDLGVEIPKGGDLSGWARQGVLLLNTSLTVVENKPQSHAGKGWEIFTDSVIRAVSEMGGNRVFMLWGNPAQKKEKLIGSSHLILKSSHPSPLSYYRGFDKCRHFSQANEFLKENGIKPVDWADRR